MLRPLSVTQGFLEQWQFHQLSSQPRTSADPHMGASSPASRCYFSPPAPAPRTPPGETAHFRQDALPKSWCNPGKKKKSTQVPKPGSGFCQLRTTETSGKNTVVTEGTLNWRRSNTTGHVTLPSSIILPTDSVLNVHSVVIHSWRQNIKRSKHQIQCLLSMQKSRKGFCLADFELQITTPRKKADSGLIGSSLAISTTFKAKNCKYSLCNLNFFNQTL